MYPLFLKVYLCPFVNTPSCPFLPLPNSSVTTDLLCVTVVCGGFYNLIPMEHTVLLVQLISLIVILRFLHIVCINSSFLLLSRTSWQALPLFVYPFIYGCLFEQFIVFSYQKILVYKVFVLDVCFIFSRVNTQVWNGWIGMVGVCLTLQKTAKMVSKMAIHFTFPPAVQECSHNILLIYYLLFLFKPFQ